LRMFVPFLELSPELQAEARDRPFPPWHSCHNNPGFLDQMAFRITRSGHISRGSGDYQLAPKRLKKMNEDVRTAAKREAPPSKDDPCRWLSGARFNFSRD
jgi:hypothetical protein